MAFVGSLSIPTVASALPIISDLAGPRTIGTQFSHLQLVVGGTVVFDSKSTVTITGAAGSVIAIPPAARVVTLASSATALLGKMD